MKPRQWLSLFFLLFLPVFLAGCFDYEEELTLGSDGAGSMTIHYIVESDPASREEEPGLTDEDKAEIERDFTGRSLKIVGTKVFDEQGRRHLVIDLAFPDINDLDGQGPFAERRIGVIRKKGRLMEYRTVIRAGGIAPETPSEDQSAPEGDAAGQDQPAMNLGADPTHRLYAGHTCRYVLNAPGRVLKTSPGGKIEGNRVTWVFPMMQAMTGDLVMTASYRAPLPIWIWAALGAAAFLGLAAALLLVLRRRSFKRPPKGAAPPEPAGT